jgi:hypothetical protein
MRLAATAFAATWTAGMWKSAFSALVADSLTIDPFHQHGQGTFPRAAAQ